MKKMLIFAITFLLVALTFINGQAVYAKTKDYEPIEDPEEVPGYCPIYGAKHLPNRKKLAKILIDGDSTYTNFTKAECDCGAEVFYDGYPRSGYVGRYFYHYYDTEVDPNLNITIYKVHDDDIREEYDSGELIDWNLQ